MLQSEPVTSFLVASVSRVILVSKNNSIGKFTSNFNCIIFATIIYYNNKVNYFLRHDIVIRLFYCCPCIISRHNNNNFFIFIHRINPIQG